MLLDQTILSDQLILSVIGAILILMIGIIGFFIKHWVSATDKRDEISNDLIQSIKLALVDVNATLNSVDSNLKIYQAGTNETIINLKETVKGHTTELESHNKTVQDHEVRLGIIENVKMKNHEGNNRR